MALVEERRYEPDYSEYRGKAYFSEIEFTTIKITSIWDTFAKWLADIAENKIRENEGSLLLTRIYRYETRWTYIFRIQFNYYFTEESVSSIHARGLAIPAVVWTIIQLIMAAATVLLGLWLISHIVKQVKELVWGPPDIPSWSRMLIPIGITAVLGSYAYTKFKEVKR